MRLKLCGRFAGKWEEVQRVKLRLELKLGGEIAKKCGEVQEKTGE